jgi:tetratricopeptide (TPR) repeat protein
MQVRAWEELVKIPTYKIGEPDKNPMFLEKRVYQGSSGVVYPHPVIDKVYDEKSDKEYTAVYIENEYLKVMVLPELGGRIQMAFDKTNGYHFIYHNSVIKPALVGLAGPWISGGIEFNWPQHHRPSTFSAVDYTIQENSDGSKTIWVNEYEIMFRTKCALGFTLHPGKAYIELHAELYNRTPFPQTFLWWANPAVAVDEHYQSVFPPDVNAVYDHGKRDVSSFPIATGTYYKIDYSPGTDISRYTNIPVPTSYMAVNSEYNFVGGYHHKKKAGMLHIADHHVSPGKKQWTWGCGEFGKAWDRQLTDNDGPYFELMCGVFTDNQPDFSWIMPNETRVFKQYFMPYKEAGYIKNASIEALLNFEVEAAAASIKVYVTKERIVTVVVKARHAVIFSDTAVLSPEKAYSQTIALADASLPENDYTAEVLDEYGSLLIAYTPVVKKEEAIPEPALPIAAAAEIKTIEELFLAGQHLEQYRHATYNPEDYYNEALKRDASDIRCNNALGLLHLRRGQYTMSEQYFRKAIEKLVKHNPNAYDGEPQYNLGLSLQFQKKYKEAFTAFYKSAWNHPMQDKAYLQLAYISCVNNNWPEALDFIDQSLAANTRSPKANHLKAVILRKLKLYTAAEALCLQSLQRDPFDFGSRYELVQIATAGHGSNTTDTLLNELQKIMRDSSNNYTELAIDYANAGLYGEAHDLMQIIAEKNDDPLTAYYAGFYAAMKGDATVAQKWYAKGFTAAPDRVFPNRLEDIEVLENVLADNSGDYKAFYYLGNYYYAKRRYADAGKCWEKSAGICDTFATAHRNLGIAYYNKFNRKNEALSAFEKAFSCDETDSRILFELDQLYKRFKKPVSQRLALLTKYTNLVAERDDLYIEYVLLHSLTGLFSKAKELLAARNFHPWEGGEGKTSGQYIHIHVELAKILLAESRPEAAIALLNAATVYPLNLGEGKLHGAQENDVHYWLGCCYQQTGELAMAQEYWEKAAVGLDEPAPAVFYNDQQPDKIFYQGLALLKLQRDEEAKKRFRNLIKYGEANMNKEVKIDYFAVSLPDLSIFDDDLNIRNNIHCTYLMGLGYLGLDESSEAEKYFMAVLELDPSHLGSSAHLLLCKAGIRKGMKVNSPAVTIVE